VLAPCVVYGATGYSGRLVVEQARTLGLAPLLAGRDAGQLAALAAATGLSWRAAAVDDPASLDAALAGAGVVLNAAGPFSRTAQPVADACLRAGAHYLDITGEVLVVERLAARDADARRAGIMLMPAVGFDVVPTDCLVAHVARRLPGACELATAVTQPAFLSPGSIRTLFDGVDVAYARRGGRLVPLPLGARTWEVDFGWGPARCLNVSWADLATSLYTTGVPTLSLVRRRPWRRPPPPCPAAPAAPGRRAGALQACAEVLSASLAGGALRPGAPRTDRTMRPSPRPRRGGTRWRPA
jgi:short subunit dehydrogenase-like uncharacterized protein